MPAAIEDPLAAAIFSGHRYFGQIAITPDKDRFTLRHHEDQDRDDLTDICGLERAVELARFDDAGNYRPLKTAPNLRHGWRLCVSNLIELRQALDYFYPARLAVFGAWQQNRLTTTSLRDTLNRQSGMYRVAAKISDQQIDDVVSRVCRSGGGCLRTILWQRDNIGNVASSKLPAEKFDPAHDQTGQARRTVPLLCQEACSLLVNECRKVARGETTE